MRSLLSGALMLFSIFVAGFVWEIGRDAARALRVRRTKARQPVAVTPGSPQLRPYLTPAPGSVLWLVDDYRTSSIVQ